MDTDSNVNPPAISARTLILDLMDTGAPPDFATRDLIHAGAAFGLEPSSIRTALTRLRQEGRVRALGRGRHTIGARAEPLQQRILGWRMVRERQRPWQGQWLMAVAGPQERANRTQWRHTLHALTLEGFAEAETNVWVRPANLAGGAPAMRQRLQALDGTASLLVIEACGLDTGRATQYRRLWPVEDLVADHGRRSRQLAEGGRHLASLPLTEAAATCFLEGREAIRAILRDPLLPAEFCPQDALAGLIAAMDDYDRQGKAIWRQYLNLQAATSPSGDNR